MFGPYYTQDNLTHTRLRLLAEEPVTGIYYSDPQMQGNFSVDAIPMITRPSPQEAPGECISRIMPEYPAEPPSYGLATSSWFYSEASLEGVLLVDMYIEGQCCLGLLLNYGKYSRTVGQFKSSEKSQKICINPRWLEYVQGKDEFAGTSYVKIRFPEEEVTTLQVSQGEHYFLTPMRGTIRWWYGEKRSDVQVVL